MQSLLENNDGVEMKDEAQLIASMPFGHSPLNRLSVQTHHKSFLLVYTITFIEVLVFFNTRLAYTWLQHANWWLLHHSPYGNLLRHRSFKGLLTLKNSYLWFYPQYESYHMLFRETPKVTSKCPQTLSTIYSSRLSHHWIILPFGHESWPLAYAFFKAFPLGIGLFFWVLFPFWIIIIGKLLPLARWASIPSSDFLRHHRIPSPMHCFLVHVL